MDQRSNFKVSGEGEMNQEPALVYADGSICKPNFYFGQTFENLEKKDSEGKRVIKSMMNYRTAYSQDGFFVCGLVGLAEYHRHECEVLPCRVISHP